jgi:hypothetical protein
MTLTLVERPGYIGKRKAEKYAAWDAKHGKDNWIFAWKWGELLLDFEKACKIYEDAYFMDSLRREAEWLELFENARDFFDNAETNVNSGLDYKVQEAASVHIQDIAVRNVGMRRGWKCKGDRLIQIRGPESEGYWLMPGLVRFHMPHLIERPDILPSWANPDSTEAFYQNNRWLALKTG